MSDEEVHQGTFWCGKTTRCFVILLPEYKECFEMFDENGDGMIDIKELEGMMSKFGDKPQPEEIQKMMSSVDTDGTCVTLLLFVSWKATAPKNFKCCQFFGHVNAN